MITYLLVAVGAWIGVRVLEWLIRVWKDFNRGPRSYIIPFVFLVIPTISQGQEAPPEEVHETIEATVACFYVLSSIMGVLCWQQIGRYLLPLIIAGSMIGTANGQYTVYAYTSGQCGSGAPGGGNIYKDSITGHISMPTGTQALGHPDGLYYLEVSSKTGTSNGFSWHPFTITDGVVTSGTSTTKKMEVYSTGVTAQISAARVRKGTTGGPIVREINGVAIASVGGGASHDNAWTCSQLMDFLEHHEGTYVAAMMDCPDRAAGISVNPRVTGEYCAYGGDLTAQITWGSGQGYVHNFGSLPDYEPGPEGDRKQYDIQTTFSLPAVGAEFAISLMIEYNSGPNGESRGSEIIWNQEYPCGQQVTAITIDTEHNWGTCEPYSPPSTPTPTPTPSPSPSPTPANPLPPGGPTASTGGATAATGSIPGTINPVGPSVIRPGGTTITGPSETIEEEDIYRAMRRALNDEGNLYKGPSGTGIDGDTGEITDEEGAKEGNKRANELHESMSKTLGKGSNLATQAWQIANAQVFPNIGQTWSIQWGNVPRFGPIGTTVPTSWQSSLNVLRQWLLAIMTVLFGLAAVREILGWFGVAEGQ
jgi:hypothetical protein